MAVSALAGTINAQVAGILQHLTNEVICTAPTHHLRCARSMQRRWPWEHCQQIMGPYTIGMEPVKANNGLAN